MLTRDTCSHIKEAWEVPIIVEEVKRGAPASESVPLQYGFGAYWSVNQTGKYQNLLNGSQKRWLMQNQKALDGKEVNVSPNVSHATQHSIVSCQYGYTNLIYQGLVCAIKGREITEDPKLQTSWSLARPQTPFWCVEYRNTQLRYFKTIWRKSFMFIENISSRARFISWGHLEPEQCEKQEDASRWEQAGSRRTLVVGRLTGASENVPQNFHKSSVPRVAFLDLLVPPLLILPSDPA